MTLRVALLRTMLWSLGLSAAIGVLAVLFQGGDLVWRVVGTGFTTAFASGLMLSAARLIDHEKSRSDGLLGMGGVIGEFFMALALIWNVPQNLLGVSWEEEIALTMLFSGMAMILMMVMLRLLQRPVSVYAGRVGVVLVVVTFMSWMIAIWTDGLGGRHPSTDKWWPTSGFLAVFGGLAVLNLVNVGTGDRRHWRWVGIGASVIACAMSLIETWIGSGSDLGFIVFCSLTCLATASAHANVILVCPLNPEQTWVRGGTIAAAMITAALIDLLIIDDKLHGIGIDDHVLGRLASAAGIVAGCGTLALCVLFTMNRRLHYEPGSVELSEITVVCPRCRKKQSIHAGDSVCVACGLCISVRLKEPRCPQCDYLLYGLSSNRCPECGTVIATRIPASRV